jgi:hypothetical protein
MTVKDTALDERTEEFGKLLQEKGFNIKYVDDIIAQYNRVSFWTKSRAFRASTLPAAIEEFANIYAESKNSLIFFLYKFEDLHAVDGQTGGPVNTFKLSFGSIEISEGYCI